MRNLAGAVIFTAALASAQPAPPIEFRHLYTFGSKDGIHPPAILNRRAATAALGRPANPYGLVFPVAAVADLRGRVWIADTGTASVHIFDTQTGAYREIRRVDEMQLQQPAGLAVDSQGRVFLTDSATGGVFLFDEKGEFAFALSKPGRRLLEGPTVIALSEDEKTIYVADPPQNAVVALNREGEVNETITLPPELAEPAAICVVANQIYVLGARQHRVGIFSPAGKSRGEFRWDGVTVPGAFAYDSARRRFLVANPRWMVVQVFDEDGRCLGAFGQLGDRADQMQRVDSLQVDGRGLLYVVDSRHGKVLVFSGAATAL